MKNKETLRKITDVLSLFILCVIVWATLSMAFLAVVRHAQEFTPKQSQAQSQEQFPDPCTLNVVDCPTSK